MRIITSTIALLLSTLTISATDFETATEAVRSMGVGWNLGNTLEANNQQVHDVTQDSYWGQQDLSSETCWGNYVTKPALLKMMKDAGFGAIRVPVTWYNHMDKDGNVDATWMQRVHEVVDYVISQGLYCILNVHHDTGADSESWKSWIKADASNYNTHKNRYEKLWQQIAEEFKDYDQLLLFEGYNEMLDAQSSWNFAQNDASYTAINQYAQSFVDAVRATGGNNTQRNLIVSTYAAAAGSGSWSTKLQDPLKKMQIPTGESNHIIFEVHNYPTLTNNGSVRTINSIKSEIDAWITNLKNHLVSKGAPVIIGEWGTSDGNNDYDNRRALMLQFADYMVSSMKQSDIATFYWMGLSESLYRLFPVFNQPDLVETILKAYHGADYSPMLPTMDNVDDFNVTCTANYTQQWSELNLLARTINASDYTALQLQLDEQPAAGSLQFKVYATKEHYQDITATDNTLNITATMGTISRITMQWKKNTAGTVKINNAYLIKKDGSKVPCEPSVFWGCTMSDFDITTSIHTPTLHRTGGKMYNLNGQQIRFLQKGIYITNGKKVITW